MEANHCQLKLCKSAWFFHLASLQEVNDGPYTCTSTVFTAVMYRRPCRRPHRRLQRRLQRRPHHSICLSLVRRQPCLYPRYHRRHCVIIAILVNLASMYLRNLLAP